MKDAGHVRKMVAARGPLTLATHLMGVTEFLLALKLNPAETHRLLKMTTTLVRTWLEAQAAALSEVEGIMVLDDIAGCRLQGIRPSLSQRGFRCFSPRGQSFP